MRAASKDGEWALRAVTTGKVIERVPARELLRACAQAAWQCGDPGLQFAGTIARWHTCPRSGPITASNPCSEFLHIGESACNLATSTCSRSCGMTEPSTSRTSRTRSM